MNGYVWLVLIVGAGILIFAFRLLARRRAVGGRAILGLNQIHRPISGKVSFDTFEQVYRAIGDAYSLDPGLLRPDDSLKTLLDMDTWVLDAGTEKLNAWLHHHGIEARERPISTILDLLLLVEDSKRADAAPAVRL